MKRKEAASSLACAARGAARCALQILAALPQPRVGYSSHRIYPCWPKVRGDTLRHISTIYLGVR